MPSRNDQSVVHPRVALFRSTFAPSSETFIFDEIRSHDRYLVDVFAQKRANESAFPWPSDQVMLVPRREYLRYVLTNHSTTFLRLMAKREYAVVHGHFGPQAVRAAYYARKLRLPLVATFHGKDAAILVSRERFSPGHWQYVLGVPALLRQADVILAVSNELRDILLRVGAPPDRTRVHRLGVDLAAFPMREIGPEGGRLTVGMVGRFVEKKGLRYGIEAFAAQIREGLDARLVIVGDGQLRSALLEQVRALRIEQHTEFTGVLTHAQVAERLASVDVLLAPSVVAQDGDREGAPVVVKEASARGIPVVGTWHAGIPEMVDDGVTGFLVAERDSKALADRLGKLLRSRGMRISMGAAARAKMEREYELRARVKALANEYDEVIARRATSGAA